jgi:hypothetical protein
LNVTSLFAGESIDPSSAGAGRAGYVYGPMSPKGDIELIGCAAGYLLVNDSVASQDCILCPPASYSMDPTDGCRGRSSCPTRACNKCPSGATCVGGQNFTTTKGSVWQLQINVALERTLMVLVSCPPGNIAFASKMLQHPRRGGGVVASR